MPLLLAVGNLFDYQNTHTLAHGCNCAGVMGAGIAVEFRNRFPLMYRHYQDMCDIKDFDLGSIMAWYQGHTCVVYNLATQPTPGRKATLAAISRSVSRMLQHAACNNTGPIAMPRIGCGLGGLDWVVVKPLLENLCNISNVPVVVVTPP